MNAIVTIPLNTEHVTQIKIPQIDASTGFIPPFSINAMALMARPTIRPVEISKCPEMTRIVAPADTRPNPAACPRILLIVV